jgi:hypothetical protein
VSDDKLIALYRFAAQWHSGQHSQGYRILCLAGKRLRKRGITDPFRVPMSHRARGIYGLLVRRYRGVI